MLAHFKGSILFAAVCFALAAWYGWSEAHSLAGAARVLWIVLVLSVLEVSLSFDNAVVNATVLADMDELWRKRFLTWGMIFAVYGMYVFFPLAIVAVAAKMGPLQALELSLKQPEEYERIVSSAHVGIAGFGGAFLSMVGLKFFFDADKDVHWIGVVERQLARFSALPAVEIALLLLCLWGISNTLPTAEGHTFLVAGLFGIVAYIAVDALGADKVRAVMMPSPYTADISLADSRQMVQTLGVRYDEIAIAPAMAVYEEMLANEFAGLASDTTEENLQARIRGNLLMALSNKTGALVLTTGNKSEMAVGYCTLYGDMAGGFAVIKDVFKTFVYRLSRWVNREREIIPERIITRPPSAELKPGQTDQDSLPPYEVLDAIMQGYMERDESPREIIARGYAETDVRRVVRLLRIAEYKRRQAPVGIRVTQRGFGKDWRYPITNRYRDEF